MQTVSDVMTRNVQSISPQESLRRAAQLMGELNVGSLPVCDGERLVGIITDRDITVRATAAGKAPDDAHVDEIMSTDIRCVFEDQAVDDVMLEMADNRIRRVPVVSHDAQQKLVGIVTLGDIATKTPDGAQKEDVEQLVEMVSTPSEPVVPPATGKADSVVHAGASGVMPNAHNANGVREWEAESKKILEDGPFGSADVPRPE